VRANRLLPFGVGIAVLSCVPSNDSIVQDGRARIHEAGDRARADLDRLSKAWSRESDRATEQFTAEFIFPVCDYPGVPDGVRCGMIHGEHDNAQFLDEFARLNCGDGATVNSDPRCFDAFMADFMNALKHRYKVDPMAACRQECTSLYELELAALRAHNQEASDEHATQLEAISARYRPLCARVLERLDREIAEVEGLVARRIDEADRQRAALRGLAKGMMAAGQAMSRPPPAAAPMATGATGCASDYECGIGRSCVKSIGSLRGRCMRSVDHTGAPSYEPPDPDSYAPGKSLCTSTVDCPAGFACIGGSCLK
jgi:hypothetical protein